MHYRWATFLLILFLLPAIASAQSDWANWRGPTGDGHAASGQTPPTKWDETTNVLWKVKVPGRGHASPTIVGDKIFLATAIADGQKQGVICFDRKTGEQRWAKELYSGGWPAQIHPKNSHASSTVVSDGKRVFAVFLNNAAIHVAALDLNGKEKWRKTVGQYSSKYPFGFGASPIIYDGNVLVTNDSQKDSAIVAYDGATGQEKWRIKRPPVSSYSTPVVANVGGKKQLLISGGQKIFSYDPDTAKTNWEASARWVVSCGTMVWDEESQMVFASGGYPAAQTIALDAKTGRKIWENGVKVYEQSMIVIGGYVYAISDSGVAFCWKASDGTEMWRQRLEKQESASPVFVGGKIYIGVESGRMFVFKPNPEKFELVAENQLGNSLFATPTFIDNKMYYRAGFGGRQNLQEWLYCIGAE